MSLVYFSRNISSNWVNIADVIRVVETIVTIHCQAPIWPSTSVVTSSYTVPILKQNVYFLIQAELRTWKIQIENKCVILHRHFAGMKCR